MTAPPLEVLETLRQDEGLVLYRSVHGAEGSAVLVLGAAADALTPRSLRRLEHEYALREHLDAGWAARPLELVDRGGHPTLLLEDPGGELLSGLVGQAWEVAQFLRVAIGIAGALGRVHARGLIHKDVKPANILVDAASGAAWLTGFAIASRLPREHRIAEAPELIAGTLAYMAPEQTGRMNRSIDSRSDLYAFGVTLYELLTGTLPFSATEPMEWIHCHIARRPVPPAERVKGVPASLSAMVMKLLAKTAEERYQTAAGVEADLRRCLASWEMQGRIEAFALGAHDVSDRLLIPEKLYGREGEIAALLAAFERVVAEGAAELVLVSGYSGIGKSSVVHELHKALVPARGMFASGKFDQYKRDIPYATLAQAFQSLVRALLGRSEAELGRWRDALREALGNNAQLIVNLIPELELIVGEQPPVENLAPQDAQHRFQMVFRRFLGVFARPEHPLALFLDDLQWLDSATLDLLEHLLIHPEVRDLLLIGAYRDNEVGPPHPLVRTIEAMREAGGRVEQISLAPLRLDDVGRLIADAVRSEPQRVQPLARLVHEKTGGNPFFAIRFFTALAEEGLLTFDPAAATWRWSIDRIRAKSYTDNVVDLIAGNLKRFSTITQEALKQLACLGNVAEIATLTVVHGETEEMLDAALWKPVHSGLVLRQDNAYRFLHDRIQQAAYSLIPEVDRAQVHLRIGRILAAQTPAERLEESIFEIANQFNRGAERITALKEREQVARLNLAAGKRARTGTAYASAQRYFAAGAALLGPDGWERRPALVFALELHLAECELLTGALAAAGQRLEMLSARATELVDRAAVACLRVRLYTNSNQPGRAVEVCLEYLRHVGVSWGPQPTEEEVGDEFARLWRRLGRSSIEDLIDLPAMTDPEWRATMDVLSDARRPAQFTDRNLYRILLGRMVNLSLEHGNSDAACVAYAWLGLALGPWRGEHQAGYRFGQLSVDLVERRGLDRFRTRVYLCFGSSCWARRPSATLTFLQRAFDWAQNTGDLTGKAYAYNVLIAQRLVNANALDEVQAEAESALAFVEKARFGLLSGQIAGHLQLIRTLRGLTPTFGSFTDAQFDEDRFEALVQEDPGLGLAGCWYWIRKLQARCYAGDYAAAVAAASEAQRLLWTTQSHFEIADWHFHAALARAGSCGAPHTEGRAQHLEALIAHHRQLTWWAEQAPELFGNRAALIAAEVARLEGRDLDAERSYEHAIRLAREGGFVHNEGTANELAARFYAARDLETIARVYLRSARACYLRWGAEGKVRQLEQSHAHLCDEPVLPGLAATMEARQDQLDLATVVKMSQTLSGEIVLDKLIQTLMAIAVEHAGAQRGLLVLQHGDERRVEAEATTGPDVSVRLLGTPVTSSRLPDSVLQYAVRTRESVILDDAAVQHPFSEDEYIRGVRARSVLCLPLLKQARLIGLLYLENNLASHVFTAARISVLKLLSSQAAISLENARLYAERQEAEAALRESEQRFRDYAETASDWLWEAGPDHRFTWFSRHAPPTDDAAWRIGATRFEIAADVDEEPGKWRSHLEILAAHEPFRAFIYRTVQADGSTAYISASGKPVFDAEGGFCGYRGVGSDVTASVRADHAERALQQAQAELARVARVTTLGELAASIAHEINQPLAAIVADASACLNWLEAGGDKLENLYEALSGIVSDGGRAAQVLTRIRALLARSSAERGPCDLQAVIAGVLPLVRHALARHAITLETAVEADLPAVLGDPIELQQVILNLLLNAVEASKDVAPERRRLALRSTLAQRADGPWVLVAVEDGGVGIGPANAARLFEAFYTTKPGGLGMGLSISRSIVERHGGRLWATVNPEHGATFHFQLPGVG